MTNVTMVKGLNAEQYEAIKKAAKAELPFLVNIRIWKRNYAMNSIDIRPKAPRGNNDPFYKWTEEEFKLVLEFVLRHGLVYTAGGFIEDVKGKDGFDKFHMQYIIHGKGFNFLRMVETPQPKVEKVESVIEEVIINEERTAIEEIVDDIIDYTTTLMTDYKTASAKRPETQEEKQEFAVTLGKYIQENAYDLETLLSYIKTNYSTYLLLIEALETVQVALINKNSVSHSTSQSTDVEDIITQINSNGSKWAGQAPDTIDELLNVLSKYPLDPTFESYGNFVSDYNPIRVTEDTKHLLGCTSFFGNFLNYSNVFNIVTNDTNLITKLTEAIKTNKNRNDYQEARTELLVEKRMKEIADQKFHSKEIDLSSKYQLSSKYTEPGKVLYEQVKNVLCNIDLSNNNEELTPEKLEQTILHTPSKYEPVPFQIDWGTSRRGQGKRSGGMVMGAMGDAPRGVKTYYNKYGNLPDYEMIKEDVKGLDYFREFRYMKARDYGLNHEEAYVFSINMESLRLYWERKQTNTAV